MFFLLSREVNGPLELFWLGCCGVFFVVSLANKFLKKMSLLSVYWLFACTQSWTGRAELYWSAVLDDSSFWGFLHLVFFLTLRCRAPQHICCLVLGYGCGIEHTTRVNHCYWFSRFDIKPRRRRRKKTTRKDFFARDDQPLEQRYKRGAFGRPWQSPITGNEGVVGIGGIAIRHLYAYSDIWLDGRQPGC